MGIRSIHDLRMDRTDPRDDAFAVLLHLYHAARESGPADGLVRALAQAISAIPQRSSGRRFGIPYLTRVSDLACAKLKV